MKLSVVTTLYRSAPYLPELHARLTAAASGLGGDYEIVLVNDGSPDDSLQVALALREQDPRVCVVDLSRNFGHHRAVMTGLAHARGELVFLLDSDLEEEPELLLSFHRQMRDTGVDVVYGVQTARKGGWFERITGDLFYGLFNWLSPLPVPANQICARLMTRRYVDSLVAHRDREIFLAGLWAATGFAQLPVAVDKRSKGSTTYTLRRKLALALNSITSFSNRPLVLIFHLGVAILVLSFAAAGYLVLRRLFWGQLLAGWASTMVVLCFLGGLNLFAVGIVGIYLAKVFSETKDRPYTVIREVHPASAGAPAERS